MSVLRSRKRRKSNSSHTSPPVITLEDESEVRTVDLTNNDQNEPEIIIVDECISRPYRKTRQSSCNSSVVDLTEINDSFNSLNKRRSVSENCIEILNVKRFKPKVLPVKNISDSAIQTLNSPRMTTNKNKRKKSRTSSENCNSNFNVKRFKHLASPHKRTPKSELQTLNTSRMSRKKKRPKKIKINSGRNLAKTISSSIKSGSFIPLSSTESLTKKKRKLQDISNIRSAASCSTSTSLQPSGLSENTMKYYENISVVVTKAGKRIKGISPNKGSSIKKQLENINKRNILTPQNNLRHNFKRNLRSTFKHKSWGLNTNTVQNSLNSKTFRKKIRYSLRKAGETNAFNPHPCDLQLEGLRPIVIDGCNVAIGHGKGKFSPQGLKICVDFFATRGHTKIKVFLPQFRQEDFSAELLEALKTKCDVVFTPSQCINGRRRTPYDDRFIVQYATEFGGVIVSTDNYRDLLRENPRWQETIEKRLLMFTWVDDFLMFPVDPLGRTGPTLEEFLKF